MVWNNIARGKERKVTHAKMMGVIKKRGQLKIYVFETFREFVLVAFPLGPI